MSRGGGGGEKWKGGAKQGWGVRVGEGEKGEASGRRRMAEASYGDDGS